MILVKWQVNAELAGSLDWLCRDCVSLLHFAVCALIVYCQVCASIRSLSEVNMPGPKQCKLPKKSLGMMK